MTQSAVFAQAGRSEALAQLFKVLADPTRVRLLFLLSADEEVCVGQAALRLGLSESAVSHHLQLLRMHGLVRRRRAGKSIFYGLDDDHVRTLLAQGCAHVCEKNP